MVGRAVGFQVALQSIRKCLILHCCSNSRNPDTLNVRLQDTGGRIREKTNPFVWFWKDGTWKRLMGTAVFLRVPCLGCLNGPPVPGAEPAVETAQTQMEELCHLLSPNCKCVHVFLQVAHPMSMASVGTFPPSICQLFR